MYVWVTSPPTVGIFMTMVLPISSAGINVVYVSLNCPVHLFICKLNIKKI